ncbi:MAG: Flagellar hook-length control protein FliK [Chlamydiales bacterium]|jgi:flagellar hook-length control protein FliK|nr:Flagellar hook-length control protein FliK [Chlamydiales bacterium]
MNSPLNITAQKNISQSLDCAVKSVGGSSDKETSSFKDVLHKLDQKAKSTKIDHTQKAISEAEDVQKSEEETYETSEGQFSKAEKRNDTKSQKSKKIEQKKVASENTSSEVGAYELQATVQEVSFSSELSTAVRDDEELDEDMSLELDGSEDSVKENEFIMEALEESQEPQEETSVNAALSQSQVVASSLAPYLPQQENIQIEEMTTESLPFDYAEANDRTDMALVNEKMTSFSEKEVKVVSPEQNSLEAPSFSNELPTDNGSLPKNSSEDKFEVELQMQDRDDVALNPSPVQINTSAQKNVISSEDKTTYELFKDLKGLSEQTQQVMDFLQAETGQQASPLIELSLEGLDLDDIEDLALAPEIIEDEVLAPSPAGVPARELDEVSDSDVDSKVRTNTEVSEKQIYFEEKTEAVLPSVKQPVVNLPVVESPTPTSAENLVASSVNREIKQNGETASNSGQTVSQSNESAVDKFEQLRDAVVKKIEFQLNLMSSRRKINEIEMRLDPAYLGKLRVKLSLEAGKMTAMLTVSNQSAKELLESSKATLQKALTNTGIDVENVQVELAQQESFKGDSQGKRHVSVEEWRSSRRFRQSFRTLDGEKTSTDINESVSVASDSLLNVVV